MSVSILPGSNIPVFTTPSGTVYVAGGDLSNCTVSVCPIELSVYHYRPSIAASSVLIALYGICIVIHALLGFRHRTWGFMSLVILGCIDEVIGYAGRILYWQDPWGQAGFIIQIVLITIGPVFFAAAIYVLLAQIVKYVSLSHSRFAPKFFYWVFIPCDVLSLILQAVGGAMSSTSNGRSTSGVNIALAGLSFQVATLAAFVVASIDYAIRSRSVWTAVSWPRQFLVFCSFLSAATILILMRCCYRVYELSEGYSRNSAALHNQTLFIVFESVMVVIAAFCLILAHPGFVFKTGEEHLNLQADDWAAETRIKSESNGISPSPVSRV